MGDFCKQKLMVLFQFISKAGLVQGLRWLHRGQSATSTGRQSISRPACGMTSTGPSATAGWREVKSFTTSSGRKGCRNGVPGCGPPGSRRSGTHGDDGLNNFSDGLCVLLISPFHPVSWCIQKDEKHRRAARKNSIC